MFSANQGFMDLHSSIEFRVAMLHISIPEMPEVLFEMPSACSLFSEFHKKKVIVLGFSRTLMTLYHALLSSLFGSLPSFWSP